MKCTLHPKIVWKINKKPFGGEGSRSSMLINLKGLSPVHVMICSRSVSICTHFHIIWAKNGIITSFLGSTPLWRPRSKRTPIPMGTKFCHDKLESFSSPQCRSRDPSLCRFDTIAQRDERTDRRTPRWWLTCAKHSAIARENG